MQHSNKYYADAACEHCEGIIRHERWCIAVNSKVQYAYAVFLDADRLTDEDRIHLKGLGVIWQDLKACDGTCMT